jgi:ABC-2 type transport system permease protein
MLKMQKYFSLFNLSFIHALKNYKALVGLSIFLMTCLVIFAHLWKLAAAKIGVIGFNPEQLLWYIAFNEWVLVSIPDIQDDMEEDLRSGRLAYLLPRPISYLGATFAEAAGKLCLNLCVLGCVTFLFTWWQVGALPFHPVGLPITILFGFLAGLIAIIFQMLIGLSAFWLHEVTPFFWIWEKLLFMLGGLMLPLAVYPQWIQTLAQFTPFPAILGERSALAFDFNLQRITFLTCSLMGWGAVGLICVLFVYRKGLRILNIEGG